MNALIFLPPHSNAFLLEYTSFCFDYFHEKYNVTAIIEMFTGLNGKLEYETPKLGERGQACGLESQTVLHHFQSRTLWKAL